MKNIFNGKRFMSLFQKEAYDLRNQYLKLVLIVTCTFLVIFLLFAFLGKNNYMDYGGIRFGIGNIFLWVGTLIAPFQLYKRYNHKIYGVNFFMLPASQTEKWLSMFLHCIIVTPIVIILAITLIDLCMYPFYPWAEKTLWFNFPNISGSSNFYENKTLSDTLITFFVLQSILFLGNMWFKRSKVQKTILAIIILMVVFGLFSFILLKASGIMNMGSEVSNFSHSVDFKDILDVSQTWKIITKTIFFLIAPIGLWIVSFMKMKEQQL